MSSQDEMNKKSQQELKSKLKTAGHEVSEKVDIAKQRAEGEAEKIKGKAKIKISKIRNKR